MFIRLALSFGLSLLLQVPLVLHAQDSIFSKRKKIMWISSATVYTASMSGLHHIWYRDQASGQFQFFNDNAEWKQMDKWGHIYTAYHMADMSAEGLRWAGYTRDQASLIAGISSFVLMLPIEIFDGYSEAYGFSWGDVLANAAGSALFYTQDRIWKEQKIKVKYSFRRTQYAQERPSLLGNNFIEEMVKDYNGQSYWLSFSPFQSPSNERWKWLCLSIGYTADDMIFARDHQNIAAGYQPARSFMLSLDIDFTQFDVKNPYLKAVFRVINILKIPAPAIGYHQRNGVFLQGIYF